MEKQNISTIDIYSDVMNEYIYNYKFKDFFLKRMKEDDDKDLDYYDHKWE